MKQINDTGHYDGQPDVSNIHFIDTMLRKCIGKTDDIRIALCSHQAIINRELGESFCRICQRDLRITGIGRFNDYLILRHPMCQQPICLDCAKSKPDEFHKAFLKGIDNYEKIKQDLHWRGNAK
jgi:hypothetical protein